MIVDTLVSIVPVSANMAYSWMQEQFYSLGEIDDEESLSYIRPYLEMCSSSNCYLLQKDDLTVGLCLMADSYPGYMSRIYVLPQYRGMGIAKQAIEYLKVKSLAVLKNNTVALELYKSLGFKVKYEHSLVLDMIR